MRPSRSFSAAARRSPSPNRRLSEADRQAASTFALSGQIDEARKAGDFHRAIAAVRGSLPLLAAFVRETKRSFGRWDIQSSVAVHTGATLMAVMGDRAGIAELRSTLEATPELRAWLDAADAAEADADLVDLVMAAVAREPGLVQTSLKVRTGQEDGRRLGTLAGWLEQANRLRRIRQGSTYSLYLPDDVPAAKAAPSPECRSGTSAPSAPVPTAHQRRSPRSATQINLKGLPYRRLPKAPPKWEERKTADGSAAGPSKDRGAEKQLRFEVVGAGWAVLGEEKLPPADRPDPAFRDAFHTPDRTFWLDPKGRRVGFEDSISVLRATDRNGTTSAERGLAYDVYRSDVNNDGTGILFLSRYGMLHGYNQNLEALVLEQVADCPEYLACSERLGILPNELKNHVRCVAISADRQRYLITVVDEAWCYSIDGAPVWGLQLPTQEGWTRVVGQRSERTGTSADVMSALQLMELKLPVATDEIAKRFRQLAMRWHPDLNPELPDASERMKSLNLAMALLDGTDVSRLSGEEVTQASYQRILERSEVAGITISLMVSGKFAADWIYAANFGASDNRVYLAGYSGKVVEVSPEGVPRRVYDIGAVPRQIIDTGSHVYILTDTRLYVISGDRLEALVDVYERGELIVGETGFALLEAKSLTWFSSVGRVIGAVRTKDPIRRVFSTDAGLLVETRQHRAVVTGTPSWWRS